MTFWRNNQGHWIELATVSILSGKAKPLSVDERMQAVVAVFGESYVKRKTRVQMPDCQRQAEVHKFLRKLHVTNAHLPPSEMAQAVRDAGGKAELIREALKYRCPLCDSEKRVGQRRHSNLPMRARCFNSVVVVDCTNVF